MSDKSESITETVLYLTTISCKECGNSTTYAHTGEPTPVDQEAPWPKDVNLCPECGRYYPDDLGIVIGTVREAGRSLRFDTDR